MLYDAYEVQRSLLTGASKLWRLWRLRILLCFRRCRAGRYVPQSGHVPLIWLPLRGRLCPRPAQARPKQLHHPTGRSRRGNQHRPGSRFPSLPTRYAIAMRNSPTETDAEDSG